MESNRHKDGPIMEATTGKVLKQGASIGALVLKVGIPGLIIILGLAALLLIAAIFSFFGGNQGSTIEGGDPSQVAVNEVPQEFMGIYMAAQEEFNVPWNLLAAHHRVETNFSPGSIESYAGAMGPMQFMPCTWIGWSYPACGGLGDLTIDLTTLTSTQTINEYGGYGLDADNDGKADINNPVDAIFTAASYLAANGADEGLYEEAIFAYNHSQEYVQDVLYYADLYAGAPQNTGIAASDWPVPFTDNITSPFGYRIHPISGGKKLHKGIDVAAGGVLNQPTIAIMPGVIEFSGVMGGYGNTVVIKHANGVETLYAHLSQLKARAGQKVQPGDIVGLIGSTGNSTGPHLHFEVSQNGNLIDPMEILN